METIVLVVHIVIAITLIGLVLIQQGKGADAGASFGGGASSTMFGSAGNASFFTRLTTGLAIVFFTTSLGLAVYARHSAKDDGLIIEEVQDQEVPAVEEAAPAVESAVPMVDEVDTSSAESIVPPASE